MSIEIRTKLEKQLKLIESRETLRNNNHARYHIINTIRTCLNFAKTSYIINKGDINMKVIEGCISDAEKVYDDLDDSVKEEIKEDWEQVKVMKNKKRLMDIIGNMYQKRELLK